MSKTIALSSLCLVLLVSSNAFAVPVTCVSASGLPCIANAGDVLADGVVVPSSGNDFEDMVEAAIESATGVEFDLELYAKSDSNPELFFFYNFDHGSSLEESYSGMWHVLAGVPITFISIKGGTSFAVYLAGSDTGSYSTDGMLNKGDQQPTVSHMSFWIGDTASVPEPSSMLLLALGGLSGLLARTRRVQP
jgi:hypothetical protein